MGTCFNMDEPWKCYGKWKKLDTRGQIMPNSIYLEYTEELNLCGQNVS